MSVFDPEVFANPAREFRPVQMTHVLNQELNLDVEAWEAERGMLDMEGMDRRLERFAAVGLGGIVANVGHKDYLVSPEQWEIFRHGMRTARDLGLVLWVYDEKGYPSGTAGGMVTRAHPESVVQGLACYTLEVEGPEEVRFDLPPSCRAFVWAGAMTDPDAATVKTVVDLCDRVDSWSRLQWRAPEGKWTVVFLARRLMYEGTHGTSNSSEFRPYVNLMDPEAVRTFLRVTHERYVQELPADLWKDVAAVFTDEPSLMTTYLPDPPERFRGMIPVLDRPLFGDRPPALPWVADFPARFREIKRYELTPHLFALFFSDTEEARFVRQDYWDVVTRLYTQAFYGQVGDWCRAHGVAFSGHVFAEETLVNHVKYHGSLFSAIRRMDLPGIDMLGANPQAILNGIGFITPKLVSSIGHLTGARQIHSESSDWGQRNAGKAASLAERFGQAGIQFALGINLLTSYYSWGGISEEDWRRYNEYVGRLASLTTGGDHVCDVAVLYPIRTMWAHYLPPLTQGEKVRSEQVLRVNGAFPEVVRRLLRSQIDLDIVDEHAVLETDVRDGRLCVAGEAYRAVVLPPMDTMALETARALVKFARAGGIVIRTGEVPERAESVDATGAFQEEMAALFGEGGPGRAVEEGNLPGFLRDTPGADVLLKEPNQDILYTHRKLDGRDVYLFVNCAPEGTAISPALRTEGPYRVYRAMTGEIEEAGDKVRIEVGGYEGVFVVCGR